MRKYMRLYLLCDDAIFADVFQRFQTNFLDNYQLDSMYYISAFELAWSALLIYIDRLIHVIINSEMYHMI